MEYKEWPYAEARRILERLKKQGKNRVVAETGYGPSGLPHIGTFGEVARTSFVLQALNTIAPEVDSHLIAFSDDMDGLREAPENIPNRDMVKNHLGKPLTSVPDPFGEEPSYAHYMNRKLREFLDSFGFQYEFASATEKYKSGVFNEALKSVMANREKITAMFTSTISKEKRAAWSPFFPVCENCGRIYSTLVTDYDQENNKISYSCEKSAEGKYEACGHRGEVSILDGNCKVGWKVDWALRWYSLGVDYEMHGEDLMESARLSSKMVKLLGGAPPLLFKYELFLDEIGRKISKKIGNGISIDQWLAYAPVDSLLYFMYLKPQQTKRMGLPILPKIIDQYLELMARHDGAEDSPVPFIDRLSKGAHAGALHGDKIVNYSMIYDLIIALNAPDHSIVRDYLIKYQPEVADNLEYYDQLIDDAMRYYREVYLPMKKEEAPGREHDEALHALADELGKTAEADGESIQNMVFQIAKERGIKPKEWFKTLYRVFLRQSSGPRIGSFIALIGVDNAVEKLRDHLETAKS